HHGRLRQEMTGRSAQRIMATGPEVSPPLRSGGRPMPTEHSCPRCGSRRRRGAPAGLCPQCLLRLGLGADLSNGGGTAPPGLTATGVEAPSRPSSPAALDRLDETVGSVPRILLREAPQEGDTPVVRPSSPEL